jgi:TRAP-type C4-dicarboxylate transport system permease small subunit
MMMLHKTPQAHNPRLEKIKNSHKLSIFLVYVFSVTTSFSFFLVSMQKLVTKITQKHLQKENNRNQIFDNG